jgi:hypothetical protein
MTTLRRLLLIQAVGVGALWAGEELLPVAGAVIVPDELVVRLKPGASLNQVSPFLPVQLTPLRQLARLPVITVRVDPALRSSVSAMLAANPLVEYVEPHYIRTVSVAAPSDTSYSSQWALAKVQALSAWTLLPAFYPQAGEFGSRVRVAVLDTGADCTHPDFANPGAPLGGGNPTDSAQGGQLSFALSQAFVATTVASPACPWQDDHGHGTHVSGTIAAATNNGAGVAGLAYISEIVTYKVLSKTGSGYDIDIADAITAAADAGARVISLSLGGSGYSQVLQSAVDYAWQRNALVVAATGNSNSSSLFFPGGANFALGVGASDSADARASFSNYGFGLDVMAPGVSVLSTIKGGGYGTMSGTSMATPHVSALAALIFAANPGISAAAVAQRILSSADLIGTGGTWNFYLGYGRMNAWRALAGAMPSRSAGGVVGQVVNSSGFPVSNAQVDLDTYTVSTGSNGLFRFTNLPEGTYAFSVTAADYPSSTQQVVVPAGGDALVRVELRWDLGSFTGYARSAQGAPIAGATVQALQSGLIRGGGQSASNGFYSFQAPAGVYDLRVTAPGLAAQTVSSRTVVTGGLTSTDFSAPYFGRISGFVRDQSSNPVAGAEVVFSNGAFSAGAVSGSSGAYASPGLPAGVYVVTVRKAPLSNASVTGVTVADGEAVALDLGWSTGVGVSSLTLSPPTLGGGYVSTSNLVAISSPAGPGGEVVTLSSSNPGAAQVPASVTIPQDSSSAQFTITTTAVSAPTLVTISASAGGSSQTASLSLVPIEIFSLTLSPATVEGGVPSTTNQVMLNMAAPPGGALISLASSHPSLASPPATVAIPAGSTFSSYFTITTSAVSASTPVTITASYAGSVKEAVVTLTPAAGVSLSSFTVSPVSLPGGKSITTASVRLTGPAPAGGAAVLLQSSDPAVTPPASVTIPAGSTVSANFTIPTTWVTQVTTAVLSAAYGGVQRTVTVTVTPTAVSSLYLPTTVTGGTSRSATVYLNGPAGPGGTVAALNSSAPALTVPATVIVASGATSANFTVSAASVTEVVPASVTATCGGVSRTANTTVVLPVFASVSVPSSMPGGKPATGTVSLTGPALSGGLAVALSSSDPAVTVPSTVTVGSGASSATFPIASVPVASATAVTITATAGSIVKTANTTIQPPALYSVSLGSSVTGGKNLTGTVYLTGPALPAGQTVTLSSSNPAAVVPASITVAGGASSATFTLTSTLVASPVSAVITASSGGVSKSVNVTVQPAVLSTLYVSASVTGGKNLTGTVSLTGPALPAGQAVTLSSSNPAAVVPASITVAGGASSATFALTSTPVASPVAVVITASSGGVSKSVNVTVQPAVLSTLYVSASVTGGKNLTGTVTLTGPALPAGQTVTLSSSNPAAVVPTSVTVAGGASSTTFTLATIPVAAAVSATITASSGGVSKSVTVTVLPPALSTFSLSPAAVKGGLNVTGAITLNTAAPAGGVTVAVSSANAAAAPPGSVIVPAGLSSATFLIATSPPAASTTGAISATYAGITKAANLTVNP